MAGEGAHAKWSSYLAGLEKDNAKLGREDDVVSGNPVAGLPPAPWNSADDAARLDAHGHDATPDEAASGVATAAAAGAGAKSLPGDGWGDSPVSAPDTSTPLDHI